MLLLLGAATLGALSCPTDAGGQSADSSRLFPSAGLMPHLLAGPRDPATSATLLWVPRNPSRHGPGFEAEVSIGTTFPVYLLSGTLEDAPVVVGVEAAAFARFGLQVLEREMVATDWIFAIPIIWHRDNGWTRFRYYHSSSHMADEYNRRFSEPGFNSSRDAAEVMVFRQASSVLGTWAAVRYGYNVHPEDDERWVIRFGAQAQAPPDYGALLPFVAADVESDGAGGMRPRIEFRIGAWLPPMQGERRIRLSLVALTGPSPLGQFDYRPTTQVGLSLQGSF